MSLAGELQEAWNYQPNRPRCTVCNYMAGLSSEDKTALEDAFASTMMTVAIHSALIKTGATLSLQTLQRHRNGRCRGAA